MVTIDYCTLHRQTKKGWVSKPAKMQPYRTRRSTIRNTADLDCSFYSSFEAAVAAKLLKLHNLRNDFEKEVARRREKALKDLSDVDALLFVYQTEHPELFV